MERFAFDGCVCSAGAYVEYQGQIVSEKNFTKAALNRLIDFLEQTGASYGLQCKEYIACPAKMYDEYEKTFGDTEEYTETDKPDDISKTFVFVDDIKAVAKVEKAFYYGANVGVLEAGRVLGSDYDVRPASYNMPDENNGEISMDGITKSYGMQKLLDFLRADRADTVAFGDGYNDVEMLSFVETGVAMGNAVEELKQVADYVTDSVEQDGIFNAMKFLGLI
jgi:Cof subfamily protein (haloacid dehalogenase superfamily)